MTTEEQAAFDDLQLRFNGSVILISELRAQLAAEKADHEITKAARDRYKTGFEAQSRQHEAAMKRIGEMTSPTPDEPTGTPAA